MPALCLPPSTTSTHHLTPPGDLHSAKSGPRRAYRTDSNLDINRLPPIQRVYCQLGTARKAPYGTCQINWLVTSVVPQLVIAKKPLGLILQYVSTSTYEDGASSGD